MKDPTTATSIRLLLHLCWYCFLVEKPLLAEYSALLATELTLKFGLSPYSASALAIYGMAELVNGNSRRAYRFGKLALSLLDRIKSRDAEMFHDRLGPHVADALVRSQFGTCQKSCDGQQLADLK